MKNIYLREIAATLGEPIVIETYEGATLISVQRTIGPVNALTFVFVADAGAAPSTLTVELAEFGPDALELDESLLLATVSASMGTQLAVLRVPAEG